MYNRLISTLPDYRVLAQVSFGALLSAKRPADRNRFDRKIADFVICDASMKPIAIVELDDRSHDGKRDSDASRDEMLRAAGYTVLRFNNIPDAAPLAAQFQSLTTGGTHANDDAPAGKGSPAVPGPVLARATRPEPKRSA